MNALGEVCQIMYHDDAWMTKDRAKNILNRLTDRIEVELHISISVVCGNWVKTWHSLFMSYQKAKELSEKNETESPAAGSSAAKSAQYSKLVVTGSSVV